MNSQGYLCDLCSEIFPDESDLKKHIEDEHEDKLVSEYSSPVESDLAAVLPTRMFQEVSRKKSKKRPTRSFSCDKCDYTTMVKSSMKMHMLVHTVDCPYCEFKTVRQSNLKEHIMSDHKTQIFLLDKRERGGTVTRGGEEFIFGEIANQGLLNKIPQSPNLLTGEFSYIGEVNKPRVIVSTDTIDVTNKAIQFLAEHTNTKQETLEDLLEVEEHHMEVVVADDVDNNCNDVYSWSVI